MAEVTFRPVTLPMERSDPLDPPPELGLWREEAPLRRMTYADGHLGWLATGYAAARAVLADPRFSARPELLHFPLQQRMEMARELRQNVPPGFFLRMDPPEHTRYRRLLTGQFTVRRMKQLRYLTIIHIGPVRTALEDVEIEGQLIRAGESVTLSLPAANRDPRRFADPEHLDVTASASGHLTFGHGVHQCLGQQLARAEMRIAYPALLRRFPGLRLAVPPEEVPMRGNMSIYGVHRLPVTWD
jgi:cytochrome P450